MKMKLFTRIPIKGHTIKMKLFTRKGSRIINMLLLCHYEDADQRTISITNQIKRTAVLVISCMVV